MNGLNAGNLAVNIPSGGPEEIAAMARTLRAFRDTMRDLRQALARFEALRGVGRAVGSTLDPEAVLGMVIARAVEFSGANAGMVYEYDPESDRFHFRTSHGLEPEVAEQLRADPVARGEGAVGRTAVTGAPVEVPDLSNASRFCRRERLGQARPGRVSSPARGAAAVRGPHPRRARRAAPRAGQFFHGDRRTRRSLCRPVGAGRAQRQAVRRAAPPRAGTAPGTRGTEGGAGQYDPLGRKWPRSGN